MVDNSIIYSDLKGNLRIEGYSRVGGDGLGGRGYLEIQADRRAVYLGYGSP